MYIPVWVFSYVFFKCYQGGHPGGGFLKSPPIPKKLTHYQVGTGNYWCRNHGRLCLSTPGGSLFEEWMDIEENF